jgi:hypothetical protein
MSALMPEQFSVAALLAMIVLSIAELGCGVVAWRDLYALNQPAGNRQVRVEEKCGLADCSVQVVVVKGWQSTQLVYRRGCNIAFAHAVWIGDQVGVFIDGGTCQTIEAAYDFRSNRALAFSSVQGPLGQSLVKDYDVSSEELKPVQGNVFVWASSTSGGVPRPVVDEFRKRYRR